MVKITKRAISPEQKAQRRNQIMQAAADMFMGGSFDATSMDELAAAVGISKPALYRYYRGKETLFLALLEREMANVLVAFQKAPKPQDVGKAVAGIFLANPLYCRLCAISNMVLEKDLTYDEARAFKIKVKTVAAEIGLVLSDWLGVSAPVEQQLMQAQQALIGTWHMTHPVGAMSEVLQCEAALEGMCSDFQASLEAHLTTVFGK